MAFDPVRRSRMSDQIFEQLKAHILSGELAAGSPLPSENELCRSFESSRTAVREAVRQLERLGLVESRQGARRTVRAREEPWALPFLRELLLPEGLADVNTVGQLLQLRRDFLELLLRRAARSGGDKDWQELREIAELQEQESDDESYMRRDMAFYQAVAAATANPLYAMALGGFVESMSDLLPHILHLLPRMTWVRDLYLPIVDALEAGDVESVLVELRDILEQHDELLLARLAKQHGGRG